MSKPSTIAGRRPASRAAPRRVRLHILRLPHAEGLPLPQYQSDEAAGFDLAAAIAEGERLRLASRSTVLVPTGLVFELPPGFEAQIRSRSGLAARDSVSVLNSPGTVDSDYRGEVKVLLYNHGSKPVIFHRGDRIAQVVVAPVIRADIVEATSVSATARGAGGFGSTGRKTISPKLAARRKKSKK